jgi:hypothetical protein
MRTLKRLALLLCFILTPLWGEENAEDHPLKFHAPENWLVVSPNPRQNPPGTPKNAVKYAQEKEVKFLAVDPRTYRDPYLESMNVIVSPAKGNFNPIFLKTIEFKIKSDAKDPQNHMSVVESAFTNIKGVQVLRMVVDRLGEKAPRRMLEYYMPDGDDCDIVIFTSLKENYGKYLPAMEASIHSTEGLQQSNNLMGHELVLPFLGAFLALIIWLLMNLDLFKKPTPPPIPGGTVSGVPNQSSQGPGGWWKQTAEQSVLGGTMLRPSQGPMAWWKQGLIFSLAAILLAIGAAVLHTEVFVHGLTPHQEEKISELYGRVLGAGLMAFWVVALIVGLARKQK